MRAFTAFNASSPNAMAATAIPLPTGESPSTFCRTNGDAEMNANITEKPNGNVNAQPRKDRFPSTPRMPAPARSERAAGGRVSDNTIVAPRTIRALSAARIQKIPRHPMMPATDPPINGATMGAAPLMIIIKLNAPAAEAPSDRSATIARLSTTPAAPPRPCRMRQPTRTSRDGASAQAAPAAVLSSVPAISKRCRPHRSDSGPTN